MTQTQVFPEGCKVLLAKELRMCKACVGEGVGTCSRTQTSLIEPFQCSGIHNTPFTLSPPHEA